MFSLTAISISTLHRASPAHLFVEVIATMGLVLVIVSLARTGRLSIAPAAVGAYIGAAYWFTSSTSFAHPAIAIGRMFSNTFAGIAPGVGSRLHRGRATRRLAAVVALLALYPVVTPAWAAQVVIPNQEHEESEALVCVRGQPALFAATALAAFAAPQSEPGFARAA
jgi:hypothetical protein